MTRSPSVRAYLFEIAAEKDKARNLGWLRIARFGLEKQNYPQPKSAKGRNKSAKGGIAGQKPPLQAEKCISRATPPDKLFEKGRNAQKGSSCRRFRLGYETNIFEKCTHVIRGFVDGTWCCTRPRQKSPAGTGDKGVER
jgi:hypothetical protein